MKKRLPDVSATYLLSSQAGPQCGRWPISQIADEQSFRRLSVLGMVLTLKETFSNFGTRSVDALNIRALILCLLLASCLGGWSQEWNLLNGQTNSLLVGTMAPRGYLMAGGSIVLRGPSVTFQGNSLPATVLTNTDAFAQISVVVGADNSVQTAQSDVHGTAYTYAFLGFSTIGGMLAFGFLIRVVRKLSNQAPDV